MRGGLLLLLLLLLPRALAALFDSASPSMSRDEAVFVEVVRPGGDARVYAFERGARLAELLVRLEGEGWVAPGSPQGEALLGSGDRVELCEGPPTVRVVARGMSAFYKWTLKLPIDLNRVDREGLTVLPGIGPRLAERIVVERERRGGFVALEELMQVEGIGPLKWSKIQPYLTL